MRVAFDECIPHRLLQAMPRNWTCVVVQKAGLSGTSDAMLLDAFNADYYDVLVTFDKPIPFQNKLAGRSLGYLRIDLKRNSYPTLEKHHARIVDAIEQGKGRTLVLTREGLDEIPRLDESLMRDFEPPLLGGS